MPAQACHSSPFSGSWYPAGAAELRTLIETQFAKSAGRTGSPIGGACGFVVPHAGLAYSGSVAASVYRRLEASRPERVILLGFSHRGSPDGLWIPDIGSYRTPLGTVDIASDTVGELLATGMFGSLPEERLCDHSVEIQLPLLQYAAPEAKLVPVYVSGLTGEQRWAAAHVLARLMGPGTVVLASSDFTHFGSAFGYQPFAADTQTPQRLRQLDEGFIEAAGTLDAHCLLHELDQARATVCGREPIALMLETLAALDNGEDIFEETLDYETSAEITGDYEHSVSYAALAFFPWPSRLLGVKDQRILLESARRTLHQFQVTGKREPVVVGGGTGALERKAGAFVTLQKDGRLRGCLGRMSSDTPLRELIPEMTLAAALEDTRFDPLTADETGIEVEVSVLSPMKRLTDPAKFRLGRDGAYLKSGGFGGLLLPQVADSRNWTAQDFLSALARKAHVPDNVYQDPSSRLYVFRAQVIH